jgi:hypothetical protein
VIESDEAAFKVFIANQQRAKAVEPAMGELDKAELGGYCLSLARLAALLSLHSRRP